MRYLARLLPAASIAALLLGAGAQVRSPRPNTQREPANLTGEQVVRNILEMIAEEEKFATLICTEADYEEIAAAGTGASSTLTPFWDSAPARSSNLRTNDSGH